jgi:hypothetical protein
MLRFECAAAVACAAAVLLLALWMEPAALAAPAGAPPATAGKSPLVAVAFSCPPRVTPRCAKGYRAECIRWVYGGAKGPSMVKCCGRMGCVASINPPARQSPRLPKPLPGTRVK